MGNNPVKFDEKTIRDFEETTPFNRAEIAHAFKLFLELYEMYANQHPDDTRSPHHVRTRDGFANPDCELPVDFIADNFSKLQCNPFKKQICLTFCTSDSGLMSFTEFIDMVSSFSPKADLEKKIFHAFQIFDFDRDGLINRDDLYKMIDMMTNEGSIESSEDREEWEVTREWMVNGIFYDCNKRKNPNSSCDVMVEDGMDQDTQSLVTAKSADDEAAMFKSKEALTIEDFRYCIYRSPDFRSTFSFNI